MNFILGSGIVGYLARTLNPGWKWVTFKKSRYFSFQYPYADNFVSHDAAIDDFMREQSPRNGSPLFMKRPFSFNGRLVFQENTVTVEPYLNKLYGDKIPSVASQLMKTTITIYPMTAKELHDHLYKRLEAEIHQGYTEFGELKSIDLKSHKLITTTGEYEYDRIISTIPLNALCKYCSVEMELESLAVNYYLLESKKVDLEGASQALVCDHNIDFFKVQKLGENLHQFWCLTILEKAYDFFGLFLGYNFDMIEARRIVDVIPLGEPPSLDVFERANIFCVGSNAQWDDFMGVTSCYKRLRGL